MRRTLAVLATASSMLLIGSGAALAQDPAPEAEPPAEFVAPAPAPVVDVPSAEAFAEGYATRNAARFLDQPRRRVRVIDANAACLEHPVVADRFGCVFTLRALVIQRVRGWDGWHKATVSSRGDDRKGHGRKRHKPRFRIRSYGCLGLLSVQGGADVTPSGTLRAVDCVRVPRGDFTAPEPTPVQ